jgi:hypothetical protein
MSLFGRFTDTKEEGFREQFIKPLLSRLGFVGISNEHGINEFGKDFVFSELDRFGKLRNMIVQAKHVEKLNQGAKVDELLTQIRQAFYVPYTLPSSPTETRYVSAVYVFNTGDITDNAKTQIIHSLPKEMAANTHFFSGEQIEILDTTTFLFTSRQIRERLVALAGQLNLNIEIISSLDAGLVVGAEQFVMDVRGPLLHALEMFLSEPVVPQLISGDEIAILWQRGRIIQALIQKYHMLPIGEPAKSRDISLLKELCKAFVAHAQNLKAHILIVLTAIPV